MENKHITALALIACIGWAIPVGGSIPAYAQEASQALANQLAQSAAEEETAPAEAEVPAPAEDTMVKEPARDPFQPYGTPAMVAVASTDEGEQAQQSLANFPLDSFKLVGVIISPDIALAAVQTRDNKDYIVTTGDKLGKEGGVVNIIRKDGMSVKIGDEKVDIAVSNKVEKINDKTKK